MAIIDAKFCLKCGSALKPLIEEGRTRQACSCGFIYYDNPAPVVAALVEHDGAILLVRNKGWPEKMFGLVTGFLERDEAPGDGALRELKEELGLDGEVVSLIGAYPFPQRNELIVAYHVRARGEVKLGDELRSEERRGG